MKKLILSLVFILSIIVGLYLWSTSSEFKFDEERHVIYNNSNSNYTDKDTISIMTFNIGYLSGMTNNRPLERTKELFDTNAETLIQLLKTESVDIVAIQEIDFGSSRSFDVDQLGFILKNGNFDFGAKALNWNKRYVPFPFWPPNLQFGKVLSGQAVASKFPVSENNIEVLDKPIDQPFYYNDFYLDRLIQTTIITIGKNQLTVMNVHLEAFSDKTRAIHIAKVLKEFIQLASQGPTILLGDFNEPELPYETSLMKPFYENANFGHAISVPAQLNSGDKDFTFSAENPRIKIDYIFYSSNFIEMIEAKTITDTKLLSDHLPVLMTFQFKNVK